MNLFRHIYLRCPALHTSATYPSCGDLPNPNSYVLAPTPSSIPVPATPCTSTLTCPAYLCPGPSCICPNLSYVPKRSLRPDNLYSNLVLCTPALNLSVLCTSAPVPFCLHTFTQPIRWGSITMTLPLPRPVYVCSYPALCKSASHSATCTPDLNPSRLSLPKPLLCMFAPHCPVYLYLNNTLYTSACLHVHLNSIVPLTRAILLI